MQENGNLPSPVTIISLDYSPLFSYNSSRDEGDTGPGQLGGHSSKGIWEKEGLTSISPFFRPDFFRQALENWRPALVMNINHEMEFGNDLSSKLFHRQLLSELPWVV